MSDAAAWVVGGQPARDEYLQKRAHETRRLSSFNDSGHEGCFHNGVQALKAVMDMHEVISTSVAEFDTITPEVLKLVDDYMLLRQGDGRWAASELREELIKIKQAAEEETSTTHSTHDQHDTFVQTPGPPSENILPTNVPSSFATPLSNSMSPTSLTSLTSHPPPLSMISTQSSLSSPGTPGSHLQNSLTVPPEKPDIQIAVPQSPQSRVLTFEQAHAYRNAKKDKVPVDREVEEVISRLHSNLKHRDHMFFIDTSETMKDHATECYDAFKAFAYIAKLIDNDGIELCFSSDPKRIYKASGTASLLNKFPDQKWDQIAFEDKFGVFIDDHVIPRLSSRFPKIIRGRPLKRLSIFVFTDGRWGHDEEAAGGVENPVRKLIDEILEKRLYRTQVMLQFIRFGNDEIGERYLSYLDNYGKQFDW